VNGMGIGCQCGTCEDCWRNAGCPRVWPLPRQVVASQALLDATAPGTITDQRIKLDSARQIFTRLRGHAVPVELSRRIDHWMACAAPSEYERVCDVLIRNLIVAAVGWAAGDGTLEDLQAAAHELRAAGDR
jgi:hypothetical protein